MGIIRLDEGNQHLVWRPSMALTIVEPQQKRVSILEYLRKGKEKVCDEEVGPGKRERPRDFNDTETPNHNSADPEPYDDSTDEGTSPILLRVLVLYCGGLVTPKVEELISKNFDVSTVDLEQKNCSCLEFDMLLIPCVHDVAAAIHSNRRVNSLAGEKYTRNTWVAAYSMSIHPKGSYMTPAPEPDTLGSLQLAPPMTRHPPGKPKKSKILSKGEFNFTKGGGLGRKVRTCRRCGGTDHNRATCRMPI
ncbi:hypothetical protein Bca101_098492 [Brassica carinata]